MLSTKKLHMLLPLDVGHEVQRLWRPFTDLKSGPHDGHVLYCQEKLVRGLVFMHFKAMVHLDLKTSNGELTYTEPCYTCKAATSPFHIARCTSSPF